MIHWLRRWPSICSTALRTRRPSRLPMRRRTCRQDGLQFAALDPRRTLAGNVIVNFVNGNTILSGDNSANAVEIVARDGKTVIAGLSDTTVNGQSEFQVSDSTTFRGKLFAFLAGGNDRIILRSGVSFPDSVEIHAGEGNNRVGIAGASIARDVFVGGGSGVDEVVFDGTTVGGRLQLGTGNGNDVVSLRDVTVGGDLVVDTGSGDDGIELLRVTARGKTSVNTGKGGDSLSVNGSSFAAQTGLRMGRGRDVVRLESVTGTERLTVHGEGGDDSVQFNGSGAVPSRFLFVGGGGSNVLSGGSNDVSGRIRHGRIGNVDASLFNARFGSGTGGLETLVAAARQVLETDSTGNLELAADFNENLMLQSSGIRVTGVSQLPITGDATPGATIELSRDGDGQFDDGSVVVGADGKFTINASLLYNTTNRGVNSIVVRVRDNDGNSRSTTLTAQLVQGPLIRFASNRGNIDVELFQSEAPNTVANFLNYLQRYTNSIVHRSIQSSTSGLDVIQGGGFKLDGSTVVAVSTDSPVSSEFSVDRKNVRGTIAMALPGSNVNGATSQWFLNLSDHATLDAQRFTVFGRVIGEGLTVANTINALPTFNVSSPTGLGALTDTPLQNYVAFSRTLAGTVSVTSGSNILTGTGTTFTNRQALDNRIRVGDQEFEIDEVISDTEIRATTNSTVTLTGATARVNPVPGPENYVSFSSISQLTLPSA